MGSKFRVLQAWLRSNLKNRILAAVFWSLVPFFSFCGINTDVTQSPYVFVTPVSVPQIFSIVAIYDNIDPHKPEYSLGYYITNEEPQFVGYNLYITFAIPSAGETLSNSNLYLENGVQPSFPALAVQASTANLTTHTVANLQAYAPIQMFQKCEVYTFTMRALLNTGITSNMSTPVTRCSTTYPDHCGTDTSCNPSACTVSSCSVSIRDSCPVGTACNPCTKGNQATGCRCPSGETPPGCNL
ncbi:LIC11073 family putative lipoprotein [Leptospira semungkisensis]|uniref:LIC11073 family putative lipoprotein n=1 Tax=Leptospira semungkisensis TaxID=2484985 RepID=UPI003CCC55C1